MVRLFVLGAVGCVGPSYPSQLLVLQRSAGCVGCQNLSRQLLSRYAAQAIGGSLNCCTRYRTWSARPLLGFTSRVTRTGGGAVWTAVVLQHGRLQNFAHNAARTQRRSTEVHSGCVTLLIACSVLILPLRYFQISGETSDSNLNRIDVE